MTNTNRWFIDSEGPDVAALRTAFSWFLNQIAASPSRRGLLAVPGKGNLTGTAIETVLGSPTVRKLNKDNRVQLRGLVIELMTERITPYSWSGPVLAVYPHKKLLDAVDSLRTSYEILVIPWLHSEGQQWAHTWGARELGSAVEPPEKRFSNPSVRAALEELTSSVNLSTGLAHPSDRASAIEMFRLLRDAGEQFDPDEVRAWLVSELGWQPRHANEAADVARNVRAGKRLRSSASGEWGPAAVQRWKDSGSRGADRPL